MDDYRLVIDIRLKTFEKVVITQLCDYFQNNAFMQR